MTLSLTDPLPLTLFIACVTGGVGWVAYDIITKLRDRANATISKPLNAMDAVAIILAPVWLLLIAYILVSLHRMATTFNPAQLDAELRWHILAFVGLVTALGALISAPLALIRVYTTERQTRTAEQGHMTDRISKAVEQLGTEKKVDRIGRAVTVWTGNSSTICHLRHERQGFELPPKSIVLEEYWAERYNPDTEENEELLNIYIRTWADARTVIEWQGEALPIEASEHIGEEGDWQPFSVTKPNIEVRIGGLLSLERIAQDSMKHDKGRDHIRVMEILCAYVRENAPAVSLEPTPVLKKRQEVRLDVQTTIFIIGRRSRSQLAIERAEEYRLDLRNTNLDGCDFASGNFSAARFSNSRFEAADFSDCQLHGTQFLGSLLNYSRFFRAELIGTNFCHATINQPPLIPGGMAASINLGIIRGIALFGADISAIDYLGEPADLLKTIGNKDTKLSDDLDDVRKEYFSDKNRKELRRLNKMSQNDLEQMPSLSGFERWLNTRNGDMITGFSHKKFLSALGLNGWPYQ